MAFEIPVLSWTLVSTGGSTSNQYKAVNASTAGGVDGGLAVVATRGGRWAGVQQENSTEAAALRILSLGISKVAAGDSSAMGTAITQGSVVVASSVGQAVPSTAAGLYALGIALGSLSTGSTGVIPVLLTPGAITT